MEKTQAYKPDETIRKCQPPGNLRLGSSGFIKKRQNSTNLNAEESFVATIQNSDKTFQNLSIKNTSK